MASEQQALGIGNSVTIDGVRYLLSPFTWEMHGRFEEWLKDEAWKEVESQKERCDPMTYKRRHDAVTALITSKHFKKGGEGFDMALRSVEGRIYQVYLMLQPNNPQVTVGMVENWFATLYAVDLQNRIAEMEHEDEEKNRQARAAAEAAARAALTTSTPSAPSSPTSPGACDPGKSVA
jgi:hypothetical protein